MNKIIFGGAFDPIHLGHINMAKEASLYLDADVIFVPSPISVWKTDSAPIEHKRNMIELSIRDCKRFSIDDFEINSNKQINYSIDTVKYFKTKYPKDNLFYLIGTDQVNSFHRWKDAKELSNLCHIIFFDRPGYVLNKENVEEYSMQKIPGAMVDISSSDIKDLNNIKLSLDVLRYIEEHELYYISKVKSYLSKHRYLHSLSVANLSYIIALSNNIKDSGKAYIAGLLHDIGKDYKDKEKVMVEAFEEYKNMPRFSYHQFVGSYIANKDFGIQDEPILKAIKYHATGNSNMDTLAKIVYAADKIEPTRGFDSTDLIDAMMKDVDEGFKIVLKANKEFLEENRSDINNPFTVSCFKQYL